VRTQNKCEIRKCLTYRGADRKKCNERRKSIQKKINSFKERVVTPTFCYEMDVASVFNMWLVSGCEQKVFKLYLSLNQRTAVRDAKNAVATILSLKTNQKWFSCYLLPCSFKIFINVFPFLYVRANCKEICEEITFPSFLKKMLMSACLLRFKANYLKKNHGYPHCSLWIATALRKIYVCAWS